jgi:hypothetical protein
VEITTVKIDEMRVCVLKQTVYVTGKVTVDYTDKHSPEVNLADIDNYITKNKTRIGGVHIFKHFDFNKLDRKDQDFILDNAREQLS